ncbi:MAG: hypothetical protein M3Y73_10070 [Actinomycetota bacterium]|nr:hypothetical protein [Actinomycetota bacterium]
MSTRDVDQIVPRLGRRRGPAGELVMVMVSAAVARTDQVGGPTKRR